MRVAGASILRDTSTGLLCSAMVVSFSASALCVCSTERTLVVSYSRTLQVPRFHSSVRNSHSDQFEVSRFDSVVRKVEHAPEVPDFPPIRRRSFGAAPGIRRTRGTPSTATDYLFLRNRFRTRVAALNVFKTARSIVVPAAGRIPTWRAKAAPS
jgi:hypothetical protein